jgi:aryl-alcohol dehydrogenase-like predicted oxidoreductase
LRRRILEGCDTSLRRLGTDCIDVYYQHRPDPVATIDEALETLGELVAAGKIKYAACSNYEARHIEEAARASAAAGAARFVACQIHWNLLARQVEKEIVPATLRQSMGIVPYFPLESGLLTGKYRLGQSPPPGSRLATTARYAVLATPENLAYVERLREFAAAHGHTLLELAFAWLAGQDGVASVIAGATTRDQVLANVSAGNGWRLSPEKLKDIPAQTDPPAPV